MALQLIGMYRILIAFGETFYFEYYYSEKIYKKIPQIEYKNGW